MQAAIGLRAGPCFGFNYGSLKFAGGVFPASAAMAEKKDIEVAGYLESYRST